MDGVVASQAGGVPRFEPALPLFEKYRSLAERLPHASLGVLPTPVERLGHLGHESLWIKREDLSSPVFGGNKVRKLEFTLACAQRTGHRTVMTMGGLGTNHGLATAIFCKQLGMATRLLLYDQPVTPHVKETLLLLHRHGAELRRYRTLLGAGIALQSSQRLLNPRAYLLHSGGSSPLGTVGVVNAMFELRAQVDAGLMPEPDYIFCPLGSSGTMAGLSLGGILAGLKSRVIGVRVTLDHVGPVPIANAGTVQRLMQRTLDLLRRHSAEVPAVRLPEQRVLDGYFGKGYGHSTPAGRVAMARALELEGLRLDATYTAKAFAAVCDFVAAPKNAGATVLYWHTYDAADRSALAASMDYHELPRAFHWAFATPQARDDE